MRFPAHLQTALFSKRSFLTGFFDGPGCRRAPGPSRQTHGGRPDRPAAGQTPPSHAPKSCAWVLKWRHSRQILLVGKQCERIHPWFGRGRIWDERTGASRLGLHELEQRFQMGSSHRQIAGVSQAKSDKQRTSPQAASTLRCARKIARTASGFRCHELSREWMARYFAPWSIQARIRPIASGVRGLMPALLFSGGIQES